MVAVALTAFGLLVSSVGGLIVLGFRTGTLIQEVRGMREDMKVLFGKDEQRRQDLHDHEQEELARWVDHETRVANLEGSREQK